MVNDKRYLFLMAASTSCALLVFVCFLVFNYFNTPYTPSYSDRIFIENAFIDIKNEIPGCMKLYKKFEYVKNNILIGYSFGMCVNNQDVIKMSLINNGWMLQEKDNKTSTYCKGNYNSTIRYERSEFWLVISSKNYKQEKCS